MDLFNQSFDKYLIDSGFFRSIETKEIENRRLIIPLREFSSQFISTEDQVF